MHLKSLVLQGFKSFAQRVELRFSPGVSAIVGPNGSGKSNISDAIRWVLGEQNVRNLRGQSLTDVIFAGTEQRRPLGMASVSITFDNSDGRIPLPYAEVTITRRTYRSGESEFLINNTACRLREIHELLLDTGLGRGSMAIIGQGEVDAVLSARPEERRQLIEEVAGISRYRHKRGEALQRLHETQQHVTRLEDILSEVRSRLVPLAREAERVRRFRELRERLREIEVTQLLHRWRQRNTTLQRLQAECAALEADVEAHRQQVARHQQERRRAEEQMRSLRAAHSAIQENAAEAERRLIKARTEIEVLLERQRSLEESRRSRVDELQRLEEEWASVTEQRQRMALALEESRRAAVEAEEHARQVEKRLHALKEEMARRELELSALREQTVTRFEERAGAASRLERAEAERRRAEDDMAATSARIEERRSEWQRIVAERDAVDAALDALRTEASAHRRHLEELAEERAACEAALRAAQREFERAQAHYHDLVSRREALVEIANSFEGYQESVRACLAADEPWRPRLLGVVGNLLEAAPEYEAAIEVALGGALQYLVVVDQQTAEEAVAFLKRKKAGRATFLPLDSLRVPAPVADAALRIDDEFVGLGNQLVSAPDVVRRAVDYLLGRVLVTRTLHGAMRLLRRTPGLTKAVSLDGDLVLASGPITGGHRRGNRAGTLSRSQRIRELTAAAARAEEETEQLARRLEQYAEQLRGLQRDTERTAAMLEAARAREGELLRQRDVLAERLRAVEGSLREAETARLDAQRRWEAASQACSEASRLLALSSTDHIRAHEQLASLEAEVQRLREEREQCEEAFAAARSAAIEASGDVRARENELLRTDEELARRARAREFALQESRRLAEQLVKVQTDLAKARTEEERCAAEAEAWRRRLANADAQAEEWQKSIGETLAVEEEARTALERLQQQQHRLQLALEREQIELERIEEGLRERRAEPTALAGDEKTDLRALEKEAQRCRAELDALGEVNLGALDEYAALQERERFLSEQLEDLERARDDLQRAIAELDATSRERLKSTLKELQDALQEIFPRLFGGGRATLEWTDPSDPLESGIEVTVRPQGKRAQPLITLSGGERALAATALLFAIMRVRPSPFFVLDEVDAAMDEPNVERFSKLLREFGATNQIIVITHRQATMEAADTLFGVTRERHGASQLVCLHMSNVESVS